MPAEDTTLPPDASKTCPPKNTSDSALLLIFCLSLTRTQMCDKFIAVMKNFVFTIGVLASATAGLNFAQTPSFNDFVNEADQVMKDTIAAGESLVSGTKGKTSNAVANTKNKAEKEIAQIAPKQPAVSQVIKDIDFLNAQPDLGADYYIYLSSASWCRPCRMIMPDIVKAYPEMKKHKVEVILLGCDRTENAAKAYVKKYNAEFPLLWIMSPDVAKLPAFTPPTTIPRIIIVSKDGDRLHEGPGPHILNWKDYTIKKK